MCGQPGPPAAPPAPGRPRWGPEPDRASLSCLRARPPAGAPLVCSQRAPLVRRAPAPAPAACPTSTHGGRTASPAAPASRRRPGQQPRRELRVRAGRRPGRRQAEKSPAGKWPRGSGRAGTGRLRGQTLSKALPSRTEAGQELPPFPDEETEARVFKRLGKAPAYHHRVWTRAQLPSPALPHASGGQTLRSGPSVVLAPLTESWACFPGILSPPRQAGLGSRGRQTWGVSGNRAARPGPPPVASPVGLGGPGPGGPAGVLRRRRRGNLASSLTRTPFAPPSRRARPTKALPPPPSAGRCLWRLQSQRHLQVRCQQGEQRGRRRRPHGRDEQTAGQEVGVEAPQDSRSPGSPCSSASERPCPAPGASSPGMATQGSVPRGSV